MALAEAVLRSASAKYVSRRQIHAQTGTHVVTRKMVPNVDIFRQARAAREEEQVRYFELEADVTCN